MTVLYLYLVVSLFGTLTYAIPSITFPLSSQFLTIARPTVAYRYTFPSSTFFSPLPITYALSSGPSWLSLDNQTHTLYGTPSSTDVGSDAVTKVPIIITATDATGSATLEATLMISTHTAPIIESPTSTQFESIDGFSSPSTFLYNPSTPFKINFEASTFSLNGETSGLVYYATTTENTPLPAWVFFDSSSLTFSGQTPDYQSLIQPPQTFGIQLIATDIEGYSGVSIPFDIEVGVHLLAFKNASMIVNATAGENFTFSGLAGNLKLDGVTPKTSDITSITAETPSWLNFDNTTLSLTGTVPEEAVPANITIVAKDIYGDTTEALIFVDLDASIFSSTIGTLNITLGSTFSFDLSTYLRKKSDVNMTIQIPSSISWISFNAQDFTLSGTVPTSFNPGFLDIPVSATSKTTKKTSIQSIKLLANSPGASTSNAPPSLTPSNSSTPSEVATGPATHPRKSHKKLVIGLTIPVLIISLTILLALYCCQQKRRKRAKIQHPYITTTKEQISAPISAKTSVLEIVKPVYIITPLELDMSAFSTNNSLAAPTDLPTQKEEPEPATPSKTQTQTQTQLQTQIQIPAHPTRAIKASLRRSQTSISTRLSRIYETSPLPSTTALRSRAYSENALSTTNRESQHTRRSTRDSSDMLHSRTGTQRTNSGTSASTGNANWRLTRNYSNYSRKGHKRRTAVVFAHNPIEVRRSVKESISGIQNGRDDEFEQRRELVPPPVGEYSVMSRPRPSRVMEVEHPNLQQGNFKRNSSVSQKRGSRFMAPPGLGRRNSGIGHGGRESISSFAEIDAMGVKRKSFVGHGIGGLDWKIGGTSRVMGRDERTLEAGGDEFKRISGGSALSRYSDDFELPTAMTGTATRFEIRAVTKSPSFKVGGISEVISVDKVKRTSSRPVSRRIGDSPFFGASSLSRASKRGVKRMSGRNDIDLADGTYNHNFADSPTVPEREGMMSMEEAIMRGMREDSVETGTSGSVGGFEGRRKDSFKLAKEGTRQLRSYIQQQQQQQIRRSRTMESVETADSRFESAGGSPFSKGPSRSPKRRVGGAARNEGEFEEYMEDDGDPNWEAYESSSAHDSFGNVIEYSMEEAPEVGTAAAVRTKVRCGPGLGSSDVDDGNGEGMAKVKIRPGKGTRPLSRGPWHRKDSSIAIIQRTTPDQDWSAYI